MIRHPVPAPLERLIDSEFAGWREKAAARTAAFLRAGKYNEKAGIWSEIKTLYMRLQHNKCGYCERELASVDYGGATEHHMDHYRPKNAVKAWPPPTDGADPLPFATGPAFASGYYWLAYEPCNYVATCGKCNSPLKSNHFPIAGSRCVVGDRGTPLAAEAPFLIYPLGNGDEDPEELITFNGIIAVPAKRHGPRRCRAVVIIRFSRLNLREELLRGRANRLSHLYFVLKMLRGRPSKWDKARAQEQLEQLQDPSSPHAGCVRAALRSYRDNPRKALDVLSRAEPSLKKLAPAGV